MQDSLIWSWFSTFSFIVIESLSLRLLLSEFSLDTSILETMLLTDVRGVFNTVENDSKYPLKNKI